MEQMLADVIAGLAQATEKGRLKWGPPGSDDPKIEGCFQLGIHTDRQWHVFRVYPAGGQALRFTWRRKNDGGTSVVADERFGGEPDAPEPEPGEAECRRLYRAVVAQAAEIGKWSEDVLEWLRCRP